MSSPAAVTLSTTIMTATKVTAEITADGCTITVFDKDKEIAKRTQVTTAWGAEDTEPGSFNEDFDEDDSLMQDLADNLEGFWSFDIMRQIYKIRDLSE